LSLLPWFAYAFLWLPIVILVVFSFNDSRANAVWRGFTLHWYQGLFAGQFGDQPNFNTATLTAAIWRSLVVGVISTCIATVFGTMTALGLDRYHFRGRRAVELLMTVPIVIPEITLGLSLLLFFSAAFSATRSLSKMLVEIIPGLAPFTPTLSLATIIIGHVVFSLPFVVIAVRARLAGMGTHLEEAAKDLGANEWQTFYRITFPLLLPGILAGALLTFTLSLDDFIITFFTSGPGTTTLPLFVQGMIKFQITPDINAISTLMVATSIGLVLLSLALQRRKVS
jgi:spermidine/putrescine transport system permease protein